jgi:ketosteroid isomerase-like protein
VDVGSGGDLGYTLGRYELRFTGPDGAMQTSTGAYLTVWRRGPDGAWKVVLDQGTPDPSPAP